MQPSRDTRQLNWPLAWAVVFCDIGTSVYYVPGILYGHVRDATPFFVLLTTGGFILLALKYTEISWRNPEGGGVVSITTKAFGPMWGCLGGMLITVDYFLTTAISAVSGFQYVGSIFPALDAHVVLLACAGVILLAVLNIIGIRESATVALVMAASAFTVDVIVVGASLYSMDSAEWSALASHLKPGETLSFYDFLVGFSASWLAYSGLESISQISPAMRYPLRRTTRAAMAAVMGTVIVTAPFLTALSVAVLPPEVKATQSERFISELGFASGGFGVKLAVVMTASSLLLFASNTAIIGAYHVFLALANRGFLPQLITTRSRTFNTPYMAIIIATAVPVLVVLMTQGKMALLGDLYAFGLLGAFFFSSLSLDVIRWRLGRRQFGFWIGILTTAMVMVAWMVNFVEKDLATIFGGGLTAIGMLIAVGFHDKWFLAVANRIPIIHRYQERAFEASENLVEEELGGLVTLAEAVALKPLYRSSTLLAVRGESSRLIQEGIIRARGKGEPALYCIYVEEWPGLFDGATPHKPNEEGLSTLKLALQEAKDKNIEIIPIWAISYNAAEAIAKAARQLEVEAVFVGASRRSAFYQMLRGHVVKGLMKRLPRDCHLTVCN
ncbi:MAG TPA: APC family permease [Candidatus Binatia bacterium]|jgi:amino acid transporter/nucleotide-binding universal stress UspA family protein|nr:APC family permease [Candidatus Binatia bacterium]